MNGKIKAVVVVALTLCIVASATYMVPVLAYSNGTTDQTRDREMKKIQDGECVCDCICDCDQNQNQYQHQDQAQNQPNSGFNWQYCYEHQLRHQNIPTE
ncbi:MAG: hypothetical protein L6N96_05785 [Candidatus Methylarchaceae archaeon HK02M2]|nr:hypothetical protein [Candidatus Methylarchaceae archaeon HK02M2]